MTDEVTPTREQCVEFCEKALEAGYSEVMERYFRAILSHLRTPRVEAETCITCGKPREVSPNFCSNAFHLPRVEAGERWTDDELRALWREFGGSFHGPNVETGTMPEADLLPFLRALSRRPSEAVDGARGEAECATCHGFTVIPDRSTPDDVKDCPDCAKSAAPSRRLTGAEREALEAGFAALDNLAKAYAPSRGFDLGDNELPSWDAEKSQKFAKHAATLRALASEDGAAVGAAEADARDAARWRALMKRREWVFRDDNDIWVALWNRAVGDVQGVIAARVDATLAPPSPPEGGRT